MRGDDEHPRRTDTLETGDELTFLIVPSKASTGGGGQLPLQKKFKKSTLIFGINYTVF